MGLLKKEANGERNGEAPLILLHAEDQMAGTETMRVMPRSSLRSTNSYRHSRPSWRFRRDGSCGSHTIQSLLQAPGVSLSRAFCLASC